MLNQHLSETPEAGDCGTLEQSSEGGRRVFGTAIRLLKRLVDIGCGGRGCEVGERGENSERTTWCKKSDMC